MKFRLSKIPITLKILLIGGSSFLAISCQEEAQIQHRPSEELIGRESSDRLYIPLPKKNPPLHYPWQEKMVSNFPKITKEFFRCKGSLLNPEKTIDTFGKTVVISDCGGTERHSLPLKGEREFIYPTLITLLNHIQSKTQKKVVITSGHRCPEHNTYVDPSLQNSYSKHLIGAEVSFYVKGMENDPLAIIEILSDFYKNESPYKDKEHYPFQRYEKKDTNVMIPPWYNKEVFIKLYDKLEGRNFDNRHPFPYIAIQIRYDESSNERVNYSWDKAYKNYLRK